MVSNLFLWRETEKNGARAKPGHEKTVLGNKNKIVKPKAEPFFNIKIGWN